MERVNLGYSVKNIPTPSERTYKKQLVESIEAVIKRMRWKAIFFDPERDATEETLEIATGTPAPLWPSRGATGV